VHHGRDLEVAIALCARPPSRLDENGGGGAEPKYTAEVNKRIFDGARSAGAGGTSALDRITDRGRTGRCRCAIRLALPARAEDRRCGRKALCESNDTFVAKAAEIVGLYLDPPTARWRWRWMRSH
jgi:hypothetical protein